MEYPVSGMTVKGWFQPSRTLTGGVPGSPRPSGAEKPALPTSGSDATILPFGPAETVMIHAGSKTTSTA